MDGFIFINKEAGLTSRDVCDIVGKTLHTKKVGHSGTLDPFATGLLIVSVGKATKSGTFLDDFDKKYVATLKLGEETDSLDLTGKVIKTAPIRKYTKQEIEEVLNSFLGASKQLPPMTSAIHVNGKKLYKLAHQGIEVDRPTRDIFIHDIKLISYENDLITFEAHVSKGTYIRVLGKDIAEKLGTCGHLVSLNRTAIGPFNVEESISLKEVNEENGKSIYSVLSKVADVITYLDDKIKDVKDGKILTIECDTKRSKVMVVDLNNNPIAMYTRDSENKFVFRRGLF